MPTDTETRSGTFSRSGWRSRRRGRWTHAAGGLAAVATAGLLAAGPAGAQPVPRSDIVFVHSAKSGELGGGRLTLHGVSGRVTWAHNSGRTGVMTVKRLHRTLFSAMTATATGTLHVAGHRGGDELTLKLSQPRYNAARRTVSYKMKRLGNGRLPSRAAQTAGAARRFGAASLSMVGAPQGSVTVQQITYGCANTDPSNPTCWGVLYASGIQANGGLFVNVTFSDGSTQRYDYSGFAEEEGGNVQNPPVYLQLPCTNNFNLGARITSVEAKDAASGQPIPSGGISPPLGCAGA
jgi:hypothetical protein